MLTCPSGGLFMVLRARWIFGKAGEPEGDDEEEEGAGGRTVLLLAGPETLIFARPGDDIEDVEGGDDNAEEEVDRRDFAACPTRERYKQCLWCDWYLLVELLTQE